MGDIDPFTHRRAANPYPVQTAHVGEATDATSGARAVAVTLGSHDLTVAPVTLILTPDQADALAEQLATWAGRARARSLG